MVSNGPYRGPHRYPGHEMSSIDNYLACAYDHRPSHVLAPHKGSLDHVRNIQRTGACALEDRNEGPDVNLTALGLPIYEELEDSLLALHNTGRQEDEQLLF